MPRARQHGFTLIELLVVIGILAVLAGLLLLAADRGLMHSRRAACVSVHSQLGHALRLYGLGYDQLLPPFGYYMLGDDPPFYSPFWTETISDFLHPNLEPEERLSKAVGCPSWRKGRNWLPQSRGIACNFGDVFRYYCPGFVGNHHFRGCGSIELTAIKDPSATMLLMDGDPMFSYTTRKWPRIYDWDSDGLFDTPKGTAWIYGGGAPFRHGGRCNVLYADGHVDAVPGRTWLTDDDAWNPG